jgi:REP element-mobilizing transposase RayT
MARPLRVEFEGAIYYLCLRGNARQRIFWDDRDRVRFLEFLEQSAARFAVAIFCFVLMGNHVHLVAQTHRPNLSRWMHWLSVAYTVFFNRRHRTSGHLFQGRYKSFLVQEGDHLLGLSRYVHLNPVRGVSLGKGAPNQRRKRLRAFRWSSYPGYAGLKRPYPFVEEEMVLGELGGARKGERVRYGRFVEEGLAREIENPFEAVRWQAVLGNETFVQKLRDRLKGLHKHRREIPSLRRIKEGPKTEEVLKKVAKKFKVESGRMLEKGERGLEARNIAMWMVWESGAKSLREIGELFGGLDYAAVAQRIRRTRVAHDARGRRKLLGEMLNVET